MTTTEEARTPGQVPGRAAFARWSSLKPEYQDRIWAGMSDDVRAFWVRQEDEQAVAAILATPDAKILAGISTEHMKELRAERDGAVHKARVQAAIREAISDSSTVEFHDISEDGVTSLAILATRAALAAPRADSAERTAGEGISLAECVELIERCIKLAEANNLDRVEMGGGLVHWRTILAHLRSTPAPSSPGVPDSVRALLVRAYYGVRIGDELDMGGRSVRISGLNDDGTQAVRDWLLDLRDSLATQPLECSARACSTDLEEEHAGLRETYARLSPNPENVLISAHPAGKSIGQGAETDALVDRFAAALKAKLRAAEAKYGWRNGWLQDDWAADCQRELMRHVGKGDPLDAAAYAAFCWHHGWPTAPDSTRTGQEGTPLDADDVMRRLKAGSAIDSTRTGPVGTEARLIGPKMTPEQEERIAHNLCGEFGPDAVIANAAFAKAFYTELYAAAHPAAPEAQGADIEDRLSEILTASQVQDLSDRLLGAYMAPHGGLHLDNAEVTYLWTKLGGALNLPAPPSSGQGGR
ncbi:hypothetical protein CLBKND_03455 [Methylorubrum aminovorans]